MKRLTIFLLALATLQPGGFFPHAGAQEAWPDPGQIAQFAAEMKARHGIDEQTLKSLLDAVQPNASVLKAIAPPETPGVKSWEKYRAQFLTQRRIQGGVGFWSRHLDTLQRAEKEFGVPASIIVAIIGVETEYGRFTGGYEVFEALATLAFAYPPRADFFKRQLEEFLLLSQENRFPVRHLKGSFAGAIGIPQFMPGSQRRYAVDYDGDGKIDLMNSPVDAIGSVARFLNLHGWTPGGPIMSPATPPESALPAWISAGIKPWLDESGLRSAGVEAGQFPVAYPVALIDLETPNAPTEYWWGHPNFYTITRYNRSSFYATSVTLLAAAIEAQRNIETSGMSSAEKPGQKKSRRRS